jgi:hypothetical protein
MKVGWAGGERAGAPMARGKVETTVLSEAVVLDASAPSVDVDTIIAMLSTGKDVINVCSGSDGIFSETQERSSHGKA